MIKSLIKQIYSFKIEEKLLFNPFIGYRISSIGEYSGVNVVKRETPIVLSISSADIESNELAVTIYSLLNQKLKPDRLILWLDEKYENISNLPYSITQFIKNGLEIRFVRYLWKYTKSYYPLKEFSESIIVTAESGYYYSSDWLKKLYLSYVASPNDILVHQCKKVETSLKGVIQPYETWKKCSLEEASYTNFIVGKGGVLFPPKCFTKEALRTDIFLKNSFLSDDLWFWIMSLVHNRKICLVKNSIKSCKNVSILNFLNCIKEEKEYSKKMNIQMNNLMKLYGQNVLNKIF